MRYENVLLSDGNSLGVFRADSYSRFELLVLLFLQNEYSSSLGNVNQGLLLFSPSPISFLHTVSQTLNSSKRELRTALGNQQTTIKC